METELNTLEKALREKNLPEAKRLIEEAVKQKMTDAEEGEVLTGVASAYMDLVNRTNEAYRASLQEILNGLEKINRAESKSGDKVKLAGVRESLGMGK